MAELEHPLPRVVEANPRAVVEADLLMLPVLQEHHGLFLSRCVRHDSLARIGSIVQGEQLPLVPGSHI